jgi:hypothetical protein
MVICKGYLNGNKANTYHEKGFFLNLAGTLGAALGLEE